MGIEDDRERLMAAATRELENCVARLHEEFCLRDEEIIGILTMYSSLMAIQSMGYLVECEEEEEEEEEE